jgi:hypothetical protein
MTLVQENLKRLPRIRTPQADARRVAEEFLREAAFVAEMTRRVKEAILHGTPLPHEPQD